jgi:hypothetical protein
MTASACSAASGHVSGGVAHRSSCRLDLVVSVWLEVLNRPRVDWRVSDGGKSEGSIFPYRNGFAAYVWITTPSGKRPHKYVYGRTREIVHSRWLELTRKAARGPFVTKVPTVAQ